MLHEARADAGPLGVGQHIPVTQERHVLHALEPSDTGQRPAEEDAVPREPPGLLVPLVGRHLRLVVLREWKELAIPARGLVDDGERRLAVGGAQPADGVALWSGIIRHRPREYTIVGMAAA